jgi:NAD+ synthase
MGLVEEISAWIKLQVEEAKAKGIVLGLSGGVDSSVVAGLSKKALGDRVLGLIMPCQSLKLDEEHALVIAKLFQLRIERIVLDDIYHGLVKILPKGNKIALANLKPRLRMMILYYFANNLNYLVAGTGNKSELMVGYFTKYGDGGVDILPLGGLLKTQVIELAKELGIPKEIIDKPPSAGLWPGQTDKNELGISYNKLDKALLALESKEEKVKAFDVILTKVKNLITTSEHKRQPPKIFYPSK